SPCWTIAFAPEQRQADNAAADRDFTTRLSDSDLSAARVEGPLKGAPPRSIFARSKVGKGPIAYFDTSGGMGASAALSRKVGLRKSQFLPQTREESFCQPSGRWLIHRFTA
ncbi:hypothetical protein, partial [Aquicoccus sp. SU-CL01552]|uniref:hypothetical protein n=1 Tax=Aquicoccus sp. SU-CL01552 TaxID=3127656 RepID=UPI00333F3761